LLLSNKPIELASSDHIPVINSVISGLAISGGKLIHISGTGVLNDTSTGFGEPAPKVYDDIEDIKEITSLPESALHRNVDDAVITGGVKNDVPTAIICPPLIYGVGEGPIKTRSIQIPYLSEAILKRGRAFTVGKGRNIWDCVLLPSILLLVRREAQTNELKTDIHVSDVSKACVLLIEEALKPQGGSAQWGPDGYYFVESGQFAWTDISEKVAQIAKGYGKLEVADIDRLSVEEACKFHPWAPVLWGGNCRSRASRLRSLGWKPEGPAIGEALPAMVKAEIDALQV
jgi:nucleoside-diphosphate-sugar epimerase